MNATSNTIRPVPTLDEFLARCNGEGRNKARARTFDESDFLAYAAAIAEAQRAALEAQPFYAEADAGGVAKAYMKNNWNVHTAQWGVWVDPETLTVAHVCGRERLNTNGNVGCARPYGERRYHQDWERAAKALDASHA